MRAPLYATLGSVQGGGLASVVLGCAFSWASPARRTVFATNVPTRFARDLVRSNSGEREPRAHPGPERHGCRRAVLGLNRPPMPSLEPTPRAAKPTELTGVSPVDGRLLPPV